VWLLDDADVVLVTNIVDSPPTEVRIGMEVGVLFERRGDVCVPMFRPVL
jgi:hypothetical protein